MSSSVQVTLYPFYHVLLLHTPPPPSPPPLRSTGRSESLSSDPPAIPRSSSARPTQMVYSTLPGHWSHDNNVRVQSLSSCLRGWPSSLSCAACGAKGKSCTRQKPYTNTAGARCACKQVASYPAVSFHSFSPERLGYEASKQAAAQTTTALISLLHTPASPLLYCYTAPVLYASTDQLPHDVLLVLYCMLVLYVCYYCMLVLYASTVC